MDRRVQRTRAQLKAALTELMAEKDIQDITVCELADKVNISRGTFYLHYKNVFDMLEQVEEEMLQGLREAIAVRPADADSNPFWRLRPTNAFFTKQGAFTSVLMGPHGDRAFMQRVGNVLLEHCRRDYAAAFPGGNDRDYEYLFNFLFGGSLFILEVWLRTGQQETPEYMAERTNRATLAGIKALTEK